MDTDYSTRQFTSRSRRKNKNRKYKMIALIVVILLLASLVAFLLLPISKISAIEISGLDRLTAEEVKTQALLYEGMSYILVNVEKSRQAIEKLHICKSAIVEKHFPGKIEINITENSDVAYLYSKDDWYVILENGYVSDRVGTLDFSRLPLITEWKDSDLLPALAAGLALTNKSVIAELSEIQIHETEEFGQQLLMFTNEGYQLRLGLDNISQKLNQYPNIVAALKSEDRGYGTIYLYDTIRFEKFTTNDR